MNDNTTAPVIEWVYTLNKSIISKVFDQPKDAKQEFYPEFCRRSNCIDCFLVWIRTKEGRVFWDKINRNLYYE